MNMEKSESIINLAKALIVFDKEMGIVKKGETNPFFKNKYAALPDILEAIKEPLQKAGLTIKQFPEGEGLLTTLLIHAESGEFISSTYQMKAVKDDPQQQGSRITYQRRYAIGAVLGLNIDIDDDGNNANKQPEKKPEVKPEQKPKGKAELPEKAFLQAIERISKGDKAVTIEKLEDAYNIPANYKATLLKTIEKYKEV